MPNPNDRNLVRLNREHDAIVANPKTDETLPLSRERFDIAFAGISIPSQCFQDSNGLVTIDAAKF